MKFRKVLPICVAALVGAMAFSGCGGSGESAGGGGKSTTYAMSTGGVSGTYYPFGGAMCQILNDNIEGINITAQSSGASVENCKLLDKGETEFAIVQNDMIDYALSAKEAFEGSKLENITVIASLYPEIVQLVVSENSDINSIKDLKGKKISVGAAGSGVEANVSQILESAGMSYDDIKPSYLSFSESADSFKDKHIDGFFVTSGIPNAAVQDIAAQSKLKIVPIDGEIADNLVANYQFFSPVVIPKDTYNSQTEEIQTVSVRAVLACNKDLPEDVVYNVTKTLFETQSELAASHAKGAEVSIDEALFGISTPLHSGAEKYYKEKGVIK